MAGLKAGASMVPLIRCSSCGLEVELPKMAKHVCIQSSQPKNAVRQVEEPKVPGFSALDRQGRGTKTKWPQHRSEADTSQNSHNLTRAIPARPSSSQWTNLECAFPPFRKPFFKELAQNHRSDLRDSNEHSNRRNKHDPRLPLSRPATAEAATSQSASLQKDSSVNDSPNRSRSLTNQVRPGVNSGALTGRPSLASIAGGPKLGSRAAPPASIIPVTKSRQERGSATDNMLLGHGRNSRSSVADSTLGSKTLAGSSDYNITASQKGDRGFVLATDDTNFQRIADSRMYLPRAVAASRNVVQDSQDANVIIPAQDLMLGLASCYEFDHQFHRPPSSDTSSKSETVNIHHSPSESASSHQSILSAALSGSSRSSLPPIDEEWLQRSTGVIKPGNQVLHSFKDDLPLPDPPNPATQPDSPIDPFLRPRGLSPMPPISNEQNAVQTNDTKIRSDSQGRERIREPRTLVRPFPVRAATTGGSKGFCRGCSKVITTKQKSFSSVDGRLTGRYHKECFVCHAKECHNPFAPVDFYVYGDNPYCAQHYHTLNDSICGACKQGIEGQYLETTISNRLGAQKFHPECFRCVTCRVALQEQYYELNGKAYCQRDAFRTASLPSRSHQAEYLSTKASLSSNDAGRLATGHTIGLAGSSTGYPERRTTKIMMI